MNRYKNLEGKINFLFNEQDNRYKQIILTEGAFDSMATIQNGYDSMALYGIHSFKDFIRRRIEQKCDIIYLCFDGDAAGQNAAIEIAKKNPKKYRLIILPKGEDANSYFQKHSKDEFQKLFEQAKDVIIYQIDRLIEND